MILKIKKLVDDAVVPCRAHSTDAGIDIYSIEKTKVWPWQRKLIKTGISMAIEDGYYAQILDRSGNAIKKGLHCMAGVIDSSYRGEVMVVLYNTEKEQLVNIEKGDKIAQMVILPVPKLDIEVVDNLDETERGSSGFGSTG